MASDSKERGAIERVAKRIQEQRERDQKPRIPFDEARKQAIDVAIGADKAKGK